MTERKSVRDLTLDALDEAFGDGVKGLYASVLGKVFGERQQDWSAKLAAALDDFDKSFTEEVVALHKAVMERAEQRMRETGL